MKFLYYLIFAWVAVFTTLATSCSSSKVIPSQTIISDTVRIFSQHIDSIFISDSTVISKSAIGDTILIDKSKWRTEKLTKINTDTIYINHTDSISIPTPIEKPFSNWQATKMKIGEITIILLCIAFAILFFSLSRKLFKK